MEDTPKCQKIGCRRSHYGGRLRLKVKTCLSKNIICSPERITAYTQVLSKENSLLPPDFVLKGSERELY